ncbi:sigma-70 family RNA polymerase sigma factor [Solibaculum mannosilyticum]|uniref:RNA polymerase sigma-F factor n=1 Tax=Solibaculum mannosilyticum TaxID=2780922 RepID=A0A7I8D0T3_9FIRM|nr:sigma-70 family RNA polymerase sigma factor [Solibaculum mannosilyticum]MCO7137490.1 sigma-70 family RNA polymerase sigma factor [[Clostridium] leptum]BCI59565.1 RNA polymerase sigma-F factor [Solibaculum mannosilyticum]
MSAAVQDRWGLDDLVSQNLGLVHSCAHRFKGRGIEYEDLFQAGCMGLVKAAKGFDEGRGVRFSTYAVPVILGEMKRLFRDGGTVKVGRTLKELSIKAVRAREHLSNALGRDPTVGELAKELGVEPEEAAEAISASLPPVSLTAGEEEGGGQIDIPVEAPEDKLSDLIALKEVVSELPPKDRKLIVLRYFGGKTQTETADVLGMTQVQVSRREKVILRELRKQLTG